MTGGIVATPPTVWDRLTTAVMNLYLLIAIALGAIAGTTEAPVVRPALSAVVAKSGVCAERQAVRATPVSLLHSTHAPRRAFLAAAADAQQAAPLTGATTPRAPTV